MKEKTTNKKTFAIDTAGSITYSLIVGSALDYSAGLNLQGIIAARTTATGINTATGGTYGRWREYLYEKTNTKKTSGRIRKTLVDLLAFNTFQVPIYATVIATGSWISEGEPNTEKMLSGAQHLALISPLIGPTMGFYMDLFRRSFGIKTAAEGTYNKQNQND